MTERIAQRINQSVSVRPIPKRTDTLVADLQRKKIDGIGSRASFAGDTHTRSIAVAFRGKCKEHVSILFDCPSEEVCEPSSPEVVPLSSSRGEPATVPGKTCCSRYGSSC